MDTQQTQWAARLRQVPQTFRDALNAADERAIRHRPAAGEWSAIEVVGHMVDKMFHWSNRVERILREEQPLLPGYDQDAEVLKQGYQQADPAVLLEHLEQQCERFAVLVESIPTAALQRQGIHSEFGLMTLQQCIEAPLDSVADHLQQLRAAVQSSIA
jgi:uncharacterized damage-inducible protein DinB